MFMEGDRKREETKTHKVSLRVLAFHNIDVVTVSPPPPKHLRHSSNYQLCINSAS